MKHVTTLIVTALLTTTVVFPLQGNADEAQLMQYEMVAIGNHAFGVAGFDDLRGCGWSLDRSLAASKDEAGTVIY